MMVGLEILAVGIFTVLAGISKDFGKIVITLMVGFWLIYMVTNASVIAGVGNAFSKVAGGG